MAFPVTPLSAPLFISERGNQPERRKDLCEGVAIRNFRFSLYAVFVSVQAGTIFRQPFVVS